MRSLSVSDVEKYTIVHITTTETSKKAVCDGSYFDILDVINKGGHIKVCSACWNEVFGKR